MISLFDLSTIRTGGRRRRERREPEPRQPDDDLRVFPATGVRQIARPA